MAEVFKIVMETSDGVSFTGKMTRREPQLVNGFIAMQTEDGSWNYEAPSNVKRWTATPTGETISEEAGAEINNTEEAKQ